MKSKNLRRIFRAVVIGCMMVSIAGCFAIARDLSVSEHYVFPDQEGWGMAFMSVSNPTKNGDILDLYINHEDKQIDSDRMQDIHPLRLFKGKDDPFFHFGAIVLRDVVDSDFVIPLRLPPGNYRIWRWSIHSDGRSVAPVGFPEIYTFSVTKDRALYIGQFRFTLNEAAKSFDVEIADEFAKDKSRLMSRVGKIRDVEVVSDIAKRRRS